MSAARPTRFIYLLSALLLPSFASAAEPCAKLENVTGDTCANLRFDINMSACDSKKTQGQKVKCDDNGARITWRNDDSRFSANIARGPEAWGKRPWVSSGPVQQTKATNVANAPKIPSIASPPPAPAPAPAFADEPRTPAAESTSTPPSETSPLKIRAFVDAQYRWLKGNANDSGFTVNDGALYVSHTAEKAELVIDLPFKWEGGTDTNADGQNDTWSNNFIVARNKAQAYLGYTEGGTNVRFGQFDTIYGFELNDAPDILFSTQGRIYNLLIPVTHTGAMVSQTIGGFTGRLLGANVTNQGAKGSSNPEYGVQLGWANEWLRFTAGYLTLRRQKGELGVAKDDQRGLADFLAGITLGKFALDVETVLLKEPGFVTGTGVFVLPVYNILPEWSVGVRYEYLNKIPTVAAGALALTQWEQTQVSVGTQYQLTAALRLKLDYTYGELKASATAAKTFDRNAALAGVYKF